MKILVLTPEAFGGFGGIAVYNIDLLNALAHLSYIEKIHVIPRIIRETPTGIPDKCVFNERAATDLSSFGQEVIKQSLKGGYDFILCTHINLLPFARIATGFSRKKIGVIHYGIEVWKPTGRRFTDYISPKCDPIISISDFSAERFSQWAGVPEQQIKLLPNAFHGEGGGLGDKPQYLIDRHGLDGRKVIMTLGRMDARERQKGFDELIDLMPELLQEDPTLYYLMAGDGDDRPRLETKVRDKGLEANIGFAGRVSNEEKADYYRLADVFSMAGRQEGFGFVFIEALACGTPCVGSVLDGSRYALLHGELGELANPDVPGTLKNAIFKALSKPRVIPERLSYFSFENFIARIDDIIRPYAPAQSLKGHE